MIPVMSVASLADGQMAPCRVDGVELLICRVDGRYFAVANRCPHAGQPLHTGRLRGHRLGCPLHGAVFDVRDGRRLEFPADSGLVSYPVIVDGGRVHVRIDAPRRPPD